MATGSGGELVAPILAGGAALALVVDLVAIPWYHFGGGFYSYSFRAIQRPYPVYGWLAVFGALSVVAVSVGHLATRRLSSFPRWIWGAVGLGLAALTIVAMVLKVAKLHDFLWVGAYAAFLLAAAMLTGCVLSLVFALSRKGSHIPDGQPRYSRV